ncbi:ATP-dependent DNA helicase sgs1, partial [Coemansia sp. BCRC 34301]
IHSIAPSDGCPEPSFANDGDIFCLDEADSYCADRAFNSDHDDLCLVDDDITVVAPKQDSVGLSLASTVAAVPDTSYKPANVEERLGYLAKEKANISDRICDLEFADEIGNENEISLLRQNRIDIMKEIRHLQSLGQSSELPSASNSHSNASPTIQTAQPTTCTTNGGDGAWASEPARQPAFAAPSIGNWNGSRIHTVASTEIVKPSDPEPNQEQANYHWTRDVYKTLRTVFKMKEFRSRQLEAINATLQGKDVFVLMPTG